MTFYISCRPIRMIVDGKRHFITPKENIKYNFTGIDFEWRPVGWNDQIDGRILYEFTLPDSYSNQEKEELKEVFVEALAMFGGHLKSTNAKAKELAEKVTGEEWEIKGNKINKKDKK